MVHYIVTVEFNDPYPKKSEYRVNASNIGLAGYRAFKLWRLEYKGRRITNLTTRANRVQAI